MYKIFVSISFFALFSTAGFTTPPANAMTGEEFLKLMGLLGRYSEDVQRTFHPNNQPNISPQPNLPPLDRSQPTEENSNPTTDGSQEQFLPRQ